MLESLSTSELPAAVYVPLLAIAALFGLASLFVKEYKLAAGVLVLWGSLMLIMADTIYSISASGSLASMFFIFVITTLVSFVALVLYTVEKRKILLSVSTVLAGSAGVNILCIMTYMPIMRDSWWYYSPFFDLFYWHYGSMQIVLTLYMISLFLRSGIGGLINGFNRIYTRFNEPKASSVDVGFMLDSTSTFSGFNSSRMVRGNNAKSKNYKKGVLS